MKRLCVITASLLVIAFTAFGCKQMSAMYDSVMDTGWTTLIDGENGLENFNQVGNANWRAEGGAIVADKGKGGYIVSKNSYKDFELKVEFWADHTTNSGIHWRCVDPSKITDKLCYEANVFDMRSDQSYATGGIVHHAKVMSPQTAGGKWNTYEITAKGSEMTVVLNGVKTAELQHSQHAQGPIALQFGNRGKEPGGAIKFRKVQIKPL